MSGTDTYLPELRRAAALQLRVIGALILREMRTRFGHSKFGYFWALGEPIVHIAILSALFSFISRAAQLGTSVEVFFFTGLVPLLLYMRLTQMLTTVIGANRMLFTYPMVRPIDTIIGRVILETATIVLSAFLMGMAFHVLGIPVLPDDPLRLLAAFGATVLVSTGIGCVSAAICVQYQSWNVIWSWIQKATYFIAGVFFVVDTVPEPVRELLYWIAITHCVAWIRSAYYPGYESHFLDVRYVMFVGIGSLAAGLLLLRALRYKIYE